jgi:mono/diheme cytochrome c family protein
MGDILNSNKNLYGITALFNTPDEIIHAAREVSKAGYTHFDVNTPYPIHGMDRSMGLKRSLVGFITTFLGFSGTAFILLFMFWTMSVDYPMVIGGKPLFSLPAFIPITFETTVLLGGVSTVIGLIAVFASLPYNNHPLHDTDYMRAVSGDKFGIVIEAKDPKFNESEIISLLEKLGSTKIHSINYPENISVPVFQKRFIVFLVGTAIAISALTYITLNKVLYLDPFDWMMEQEKVIPQEKIEYYADNFGMRVPVEGTVARGFMPYPYKGISIPEETLPNPLLPTKEVLEIGKNKYLTFCSPCHGNTADGDSRLRGQFPNPPTLHSQRGRDFSDGMMYHIIVNGQNIMPPYQSQTTIEERWAIVHYIRALQRAKNAKLTDLQTAQSVQSANKKETQTNVE